jgi:hypothetical protein
MVGTRLATYLFLERGHATMKSFAFLPLAGVMLLGTVGSANAQRSIQAQYDNAFAACMFSLGNTLPSMGPTMTQPQPTARPAPG